MVRQMSRSELGWYGETIVAEYLKLKGFDVEYSENVYDSEKDLIVNKRDSEVKTIQLYRAKNLCSIRTPQLEKCSNASYLFFLLTPDEYGRDFAEIVFYPKCGRHWIKYDTKYREMYGLSLNAGVSIEKLYDGDILDNLRRLTYTQY